MFHEVHPRTEFFLTHLHPTILSDKDYELTQTEEEALTEDHQIP